MNLNCTCICSEEIRIIKVLNLPEFTLLILEGARSMYMYIIEFMVNYVIQYLILYSE